MNNSWKEIKIKGKNIPKLLNLSEIFFLDGLVSEEFTSISSDKVLERLEEAIGNAHFDYILHSLERKLKEDLQRKNDRN